MKLHYFRACLLITSLTFLTACGNERKIESEPDYPRPVKMIQVLIGDGQKERILPGEVQASDQAILSFRVAGEINEILVRPGAQVKAGDLLATIDPAMYEQAYQVAKSQYELARVLYKRSKQLVGKGFISKNDFDKSKSQLATAKSALDKANNDRDYTKLLAPYDGAISTRYSEEFEFVREKQQVLGIQTESFIDVSFQLAEQYIGSLQRVQKQEESAFKVEINFEGKEQWFEASLKELSTVADPSTASYTVVFTLPTPEQVNVLSGMNAKVKLTIPGSANDKLLEIPAGALIQDNGNNFVFRWLPESDKLEKVAIKLDDGRLVGGLQDGDWLVTTGATELQDGQAAVPWVKERGL
ncbi:efflux transporter periplasmic adaptor subunit [Photobacterium frigidiphilum]|uniref:Efflux transporter periplasmic adaptor subunit n=2 Tax=Photobacterium frigidiphilum TaxID=264736 RepID=A0A2T3JFY3_9GAMM|nr:efflux transporter periplasmic adaptor subunit [Photobacterium frigidiphilum]